MDAAPELPELALRFCAEAWGAEAVEGGRRTLELGRRPVMLARSGEQFHGYAVIGVPFRSGHILGMRRFPVSSVGPGYTSVWHRDPDGRWVIYQDQGPRVTCPRAFGPRIDDAPTVPIVVDWVASDRFTVEIETTGKKLRWEVALSESAITRVLSATASILPRFVRHNPATLAGIGRVAGWSLRAGRVRLSGVAPQPAGLLRGPAPALADRALDRRDRRRRSRRIGPRPRADAPR